jgi:hypothetical protein
MRSPSNLPPGVTDADIERHATGGDAALDVHEVTLANYDGARDAPGSVAWVAVSAPEDVAQLEALAEQHGGRYWGPIDAQVTPDEVDYHWPADRDQLAEAMKKAQEASHG